MELTPIYSSISCMSKSLKAELVYLAQNFINAKEAIIAKKRKRAKRMEADLSCHPE